MKLYLRILLFPFFMFYIIGVYFRNLLFDLGLLKEVPYNTKVISIGNLSMGGTGKTPHTEYLAGLLLSQGKTVAILSRGYKEK